MTKRIGFTGSRYGLTASQQVELEDWLVNEYVGSAELEAHHGCCVGADTDFAHQLADCFPSVRIIGHPSTLTNLTSEYAVSCCHEKAPAKQPLDRNHDIVDACDVLLACPATMEEELRSGTWATIRYARKVGKEVVMFYPRPEEPPHE